MSRNHGLWNPVCVGCNSAYRNERDDGIALCAYCRMHKDATLQRARARIDAYNALLVAQIEALPDTDSDRYSTMYHAEHTLQQAKRASFERRIDNTIAQGGALADALLTRKALRAAIVLEAHLQALYSVVH